MNEAMDNKSESFVSSTQVIGSDGSVRDDTLIAEAPLTTRLAYRWKGVEQVLDVAVTMRTPGHDQELAVGFLYNESIIKSEESIENIDICAGSEDALKITLRNDCTPGEAIHDRQFYATSSCGVCGKGSSEQIWRSLPSEFPHPRVDAVISAKQISLLPKIARDHQSLFAQTGGNHASALFSQDGTFIAIREDIGRHNATDKLVGAWLLGRIQRPPAPVMTLSGRVSFELIQKALMLGVEFIVAVGAPSNLAVEIANRYHITLVGFTRGETFNVYTEPQRIAFR